MTTTGSAAFTGWAQAKEAVATMATTTRRKVDRFTIGILGRAGVMSRAKVGVNGLSFVIRRFGQVADLPPSLGIERRALHRQPGTGPLRLPIDLPAEKGDPTKHRAKLPHDLKDKRLGNRGAEGL